MEHEMSRKGELQGLKTKAGEVQVRLNLLEIRINEICQGVPVIFQWKAFADAKKAFSLWPAGLLHGQYQTGSWRRPIGARFQCSDKG